MELRAFHNTCRHRGAELTGKSRGTSGGRFVCMYHGWTHDLQGHLIGLPYAEAYGPDFRREENALVPIRVDTFCGLIFVSLDPVVSDLEDYLRRGGPLYPEVSGRHRGSRARAVGLPRELEAMARELSRQLPSRVCSPNRTRLGAGVRRSGGKTSPSLPSMGMSRGGYRPARPVLLRGHRHPTPLDRETRMRFFKSEERQTIRRCAMLFRGLSV
jgi:hypothetical protein